MLVRSGTLVSATQSHWLIRLDAAVQCGACSERAGCGTALLALRRSAVLEEVQVQAPAGANPVIGQRVSVSVEEAAALRASLLLYGIPLVLLPLASGLASWFGGTEAVQAVAAFGALLVSVGMVKTLSSRLGRHSRYDLIIGMAAGPLIPESAGESVARAVP